MNIEECFEKRLLRNAPPDRLKSKKALEMSDRAIKQAEKLMEHGFYEQVILYSYTAMFQGARALLFKDGITEKSHYCVIEYLRKITSRAESSTRAIFTGLIPIGSKGMRHFMD